MTDCTGTSHVNDENSICVMCEFDRYWPEERIAHRCSVEFMDSLGNELHVDQKTRDMSESKVILLPGTVFGFALRSRKWCQ